MDLKSGGKGGSPASFGTRRAFPKGPVLQQDHDIRGKERPGSSILAVNAAGNGRFSGNAGSDPLRKRGIGVERRRSAMLRIPWARVQKRPRLLKISAFIGKVQEKEEGNYFRRRSMAGLEDNVFQTAEEYACKKRLKVLSEDLIVKGLGQTGSRRRGGEL